MKKHTFKKQRQKIVPICYRKRSHSNSNTSLSQLLSIGSYKKRINELVKNNRSLAVALQEARCETSYQKNIIKNYAEDHNKIMFARLKLQGMAQIITQLVTDLHEVVNCLNVNWVSENNLLQKNGLLHDRMKIKAPSVDCIEEESYLSSENGGCVGNSLSHSNSTSNEEVSSDKALNVEEGENEILPSTPPNITDLTNDIDMPPILFVEDPNEKPMEKLSKERKSSRKSIVDQLSLTPELDIDLCVMRKRSSRKQVVIPATPSSRRSSRKSIFRQSLSIENTTPKAALESATQRKLVLMNHEEGCENKNPASALFNMEENESIRSSTNLQLKEHSETDEFLGCAFVNMKDRGSKNKNSSSPDIISVSTVLDSEPLVLPANNFPNDNNVGLNHTILSCEDMELTEIIRPVQQITSANSPSIVGCPSDLQVNAPGKKEEIDMHIEKIHFEDKVCNITEKVSVLNKDINLNNVENESCDSAIKYVKISKEDEISEHTESINEKTLESPPRQQRSRNKNNKVYKFFFSSSESESDSTPIKSNKKKPKKANRSTVIFKPKSCTRVSDKKDKLGSSDKSPTKCLQENKDVENLLSVYDLDVSNSKKVSKKSKSKPKSSRNKELSKPLSQNCNVTKLQGINYKFTKNENLVNKDKEHELLQNNGFTFKTKPVIHTGEKIKKNQSYAISNSAELGTAAESRQTSTHSDEGLSSGITYLKNQAITSRSPKSEVRRVSFASTDLVCNFNKLSESKTIAGNKKTLRTSKSIVELEDIKQLPIETKDSVQFETNEKFDGMPDTLHSPDSLFNFSEETEFYTFVLPSKEVDRLCTSKTNLSVLPTICDSYSNQNSDPTKSTTRQKVGKLSLKRNKNCQNKTEQGVFDKIDKDDLFRVHHSQPSPTHKSSQKGVSYGDLNRNMEHLNSQTSECLQENIEPKISEQLPLTLTSVEDHTLTPIDDIKCTKKSCSKSRLSTKRLSSLPNPNKTTKKSSIRRKHVEISPVLKDVLNLKETRESTKRRSKIVSYKEPKLNKKMRRS